MKVTILAAEIAKLIGEVDKPHDDSTAPISKPRVYLAETSYDMREAREALHAELEHHGYPILPERELPREEMDYRAEVARLLAQCKLSIHLVGRGYGAVPDGPSQKSVVLLQNELAITNCRAGTMQRMIWLPQGIMSEQVQQQSFIETLNADSEAQFGADLITADLEAFKGAVHAILHKLEASPPPPVDTKFIYLICDERDRAATIPLRRFLRGQGFEVKIPLFQGDAATVRRANQDLLLNCHAMIVFYGAGDEVWRRMVENDLKKLNGYRRDKPGPASYTYLAEPATADKEELLELGEPNLINGLRGFSEAEMSPFSQAFSSVMRS